MDRFRSFEDKYVDAGTHALQEGFYRQYGDHELRLDNNNIFYVYEAGGGWVGDTTKGLVDITPGLLVMRQPENGQISSGSLCPVDPKDIRELIGSLKNLLNRHKK